MGVIMQALLSGANFAVGLILIRRTNDLQYSYYILATNAILFLTALQNSFVQPYVVSCITSMGPAERRDVVGALTAANARWVPLLCGSGLICALLLWLFRVIDMEQAGLIAVGVFAGGFALIREFYRLTLFAHRQPGYVLKGDLVYVVVLICGAFVATLAAQPALLAILTVALAAFVGGAIVRRGLWQHEPWDLQSSRPIFRTMAVNGGWAVVGSGIHWLLIYGYSYLVAGVLDVRDIAAIAATRLSLMPVFVLSGGVSMLLFPITSRWVQQLGVAAAARKLLLLVTGMCAVAILYMGAMWLARDWIFTVLLKKQFAQRDPLLLVWSAVFLVTLCRDQLATLPASRGRFRHMTLVTGLSAAVWLVSSYFAMLRFGPVGSVTGILIGEVVNVIGIVAMIIRETRRPRLAAAY